jgi:RNA polymerase sigma-70 factor (ECF subfamily)
VFEKLEQRFSVITQCDAATKIATVCSVPIRSEHPWPRGTVRRQAGQRRTFQRDLQVIDWQAIIKEHGPAVWQTAYRLLGNDADAADCFQETFVSALEVCRRQRVRNFSALLARLATTRAIDQLRRRCRRSRYSANPDGWAVVHDESPCPSQRVQDRELAGRVRQLIGQLPPQEAQAFCLRYLNEMSYREIANELGINTNAAGVLLHRAKARLREAFELSAKEQK